VSLPVRELLRSACAVNFVKQFVEMHRSAEKKEVMCGTPNRFKKAVGASAGGEQKHFAIRGVPSHSHCEFQARERQHLDVTNQNVRRRRECGFQSLRRPAEGPCVPSVFKEHLSHYRDEDVLQICQEDPRWNTWIHESILLTT